MEILLLLNNCGAESLVQQIFIEHLLCANSLLGFMDTRQFVNISEFTRGDQQIQVIPLQR